MTYTILKSEEEDEPEGFLGIATSDFTFIILRISK